MANKWTISFLCELERGKDGTQKPDGKIVMRVNWTGNLVRYSVGFRAVLDKWDKDRQRCKNNTTHGKHTSTTINDAIKANHERADKIFTEFLLLQGRVPSVDEFRRAFDKVDEKKITFFSLLDQFLVEGRHNKDWSESVFKKFSALKKHLLEYDPSMNLSFSLEDANGLIRWYKKKTKVVKLEDGTEITENVYRNSTIKKNCDLLKWFLNWAKKNGYYTGDVLDRWEYNLKGTGGRKDIFYLEWDEVMLLWNYVPRFDYLSRVKDVFLFQCFSGLRYSDVAKLRKSDVYGDAIHVVTQKTEDALSINLNDFSRAILTKYSDAPFEGGLALPVISNQKMNDYLKILCREAEITASYTDVYFVGAERKEVTLPKCEFVGTHAGRRTFVVTALALGIAPTTIMKWTGHSDYKAMNPYIAVVDKSKQDGASKFDLLFGKM